LDVDLWIEDSRENRDRCAAALSELAASWGPTEADWRPVAGQPADWLAGQGVFCLTSPHGPIDVFRSVKGLSDWQACRRNAAAGETAAGIRYYGLSDEDMLRCQLALPEGQRRADRVCILKQSQEGTGGGGAR
jgi:hypothetical protein